jgi:hypothetical protein
MRLIKFMLLFLFFVLGLIFLVQNAVALSTLLELKLDLFAPSFVWTAKAVPFYFVVIAAFGIGMAFTGILFLLSQTRLYFTALPCRRRVKTLEKEVARLSKLEEKRKQEQDVKAIESSTAGLETQAG